MGKTAMAAFAALLLAGCVHESAMPLENDLIQIDVSAAPVYGRAGAQRIAYQDAAKATLKAGHDKFLIVSNQGWTDTTYQGGSFSQATVNATPTAASGQGSSGSFFGGLRHPETTMVIRVFHANDPGADKAVDAREVLAQQ